MKEKAQRQMIPKYIIFILIILILGICSNCIYAKDREQPVFEISLIYPDGEPAVGVTANIVQVILDKEGKRGRYFPDKNNKHSWLNAALGIRTKSDPSAQDGYILLQGGSIRKQEEHYYGIRDMEPHEHAAYQIKWSGGMAAPVENIYPINSFPQTITIDRGVEITIKRQGPALELTPVIAPQAKAHIVATSSSQSVPLKKISDQQWQCILKENETYVIGYPEKLPKDQIRLPHNKRSHTFRGFISQSFTAQANKTIFFAPGLPGSLQADFSRVPEDSPIFPCFVELYRKTSGKQDARIFPGNIKLLEPQTLTWDALAQGSYYIEVLIPRNIYCTPDSGGEVHFPVELTSGEMASVPIEMFKLDNEVLDTDITISGYLKDGQDHPIANRRVRLVPSFADEQFGKVVYPEAKTNPDGYFQFQGVTPQHRYVIGYEQADGSFGGYPLNRKVLGLKGYIININDFTTNATAETFTLDKFIFESKNKKQISIKDFKGKIVVVDFWATWCSPCIRDMPAYLSLAEKLKDNDKIVFLAISVDSERILWEKMIEEKPWQILKHGWFNPVTNHGQLKKPIPYKVVYDTAGHILGQGEGINLEDILTKLNILPLRLKTTEQNK